MDESRSLGIAFGRLTLGSGGRRHYGLPLSFRTKARTSPSTTSRRSNSRPCFEIPPQRYAFDSYQLEFTSEKGELRFAYPPEKNLNNLVGTIRLKGIRWRQYKASRLLDFGDLRSQRHQRKVRRQGLSRRNLGGAS